MTNPIQDHLNGMIIRETSFIFNWLHHRGAHRKSTNTPIPDHLKSMVIAWDVLHFLIIIPLRSIQDPIAEHTEKVWILPSRTI